MIFLTDCLGLEGPGFPSQLFNDSNSFLNISTLYLVNAGYKFYVKYQGLGVIDKQTNFTMHLKVNLIA